MKIQTSELVDHALDWAVATAQGIKAYVLVERDRGQQRPLQRWCAINLSIQSHDRYAPSANWALAGPIIERHIFRLEDTDGGDADTERWLAEGAAGVVQFGPTPLIGAMRCYVASQLGESVDVPNEVIDASHTNKG